MKLAKKQKGFVLTSELIILATILTIGSIIGFSIVRDAVVAELFDIADSIERDQQYAFDGVKRTNPAVNYNLNQELFWVSPGLEGENLRDQSR
ncbi:MAG: hypothetical protein ABJV04_05885 [Aliiglaciecola sp.]|uniref:hypothetical protein n=1 Tax=Aliiglaciecola sp. TaxID=1872441 RepID=UPI003297CB93